MKLNREFWKKLFTQSTPEQKQQRLESALDLVKRYDFWHDKTLTRYFFPPFIAIFLIHHWLVWNYHREFYYVAGGEWHISNGLPLSGLLIPATAWAAEWGLSLSALLTLGRMVMALVIFASLILPFNRLMKQASPINRIVLTMILINLPISYYSIAFLQYFSLEMMAGLALVPYLFLFKLPHSTSWRYRLYTLYALGWALIASWLLPAAAFLLLMGELGRVVIYRRTFAGPIPHALLWLGVISYYGWAMVYQPDTLPFESTSLILIWAEKIKRLVITAIFFYIIMFSFSRIPDVLHLEQNWDEDKKFLIIEFKNNLSLYVFSLFMVLSVFTVFHLDRVALAYTLYLFAFYLEYITRISEEYEKIEIKKRESRATSPEMEEQIRRTHERQEHRIMVFAYYMMIMLSIMVNISSFYNLFHSLDPDSLNLLNPFYYHSHLSFPI